LLLDLLSTNDPALQANAIAVTLSTSNDELRKKFEKEFAFTDLKTKLLSNNYTEKWSHGNSQFFHNAYNMYWEMNQELNKRIGLQPAVPVDVSNKSAFEMMRELDQLQQLHQELTIKFVSQLKYITTTTDAADEKYLSRSFFTPSGMAALSAPFGAYLDTFRKKTPTKHMSVLIDSKGYFELTAWKNHFKVNAKIDWLDDSKYAQADIIIIDYNPCVRLKVGEAAHDPRLTFKNLCDDNVLDVNRAVPKVLIVDVTSSTSRQKEKVLEKWVTSGTHILMLVESAIKKPFSNDIFHYGAIAFYIHPKVADKLKKDEQFPGLEFLTDFQDKLKLMTRATSSPHATVGRRLIRDTAKMLFFGEQSLEQTSAPVATNLLTGLAASSFRAADDDADDERENFSDNESLTDDESFMHSESAPTSSDNATTKQSRKRLQEKITDQEDTPTTKLGVNNPDQGKLKKHRAEKENIVVDKSTQSSGYRPK
jgi:hypothetical protein